MGFSQPWFLLTLLGIPLILVLYLLRPKPVRQVVASLYLWEALEHEVQAAKKIQKLKRSLLLVLHILTVLLISLLLSGVHFIAPVAGDHTVIIMDHTASMQATDVLPSRLEQAKALAVDYISSLPLGQRVTLIVVSDYPEIIIRDAYAHEPIRLAIEALEPSYGQGRLDGLETVLSSLSGTLDPIYFGDKIIQGMTSVLVGGALSNVGVLHVGYTVTDANALSLLVTLYGENVTEPVPIHLFGDGALLDAKHVSMEQEGVTQVLFHQVPLNYEVLQVQLDIEDAYSMDNVYFLPLQDVAHHQVLLLSEGNLFLERLLGLLPGLEVYRSETLPQEAYDLYVYDGIFPEDYPDRGVHVVFHPESILDVEALSYVQNPDFRFIEHPVTTYLVPGDFAIGLSRRYPLPPWANPLIVSDEGVLAFEGRINAQQWVVFGFDLQHTDLPLTLSFPVLMHHVVQTYLSHQQVLSTDHHVMQGVTIALDPSVTRALIHTPSGQTIPIEDAQIKTSQFVFEGSYEPGLYTLETLLNGLTRTEYFAVHARLNPSEWAEIDYETLQGQDTRSSHQPYNRMKLPLSFALLFVLLIEWIIFGLRRQGLWS